MRTVRGRKTPAYAMLTGGEAREGKRDACVRVFISFIRGSGLAPAYYHFALLIPSFFSPSVPNKEDRCGLTIRINYCNTSRIHPPLQTYSPPEELESPAARLYDTLI